MEIGTFPVVFFMIVMAGFILFSVMVMKRIINEKNELVSVNMTLQAEKKELRAAIQMNEKQKITLRTRLMKDAADVLRKEQKIDKLLDKLEKRDVLRNEFHEEIFALRKEKRSRSFVLILTVNTLDEIKSTYGSRFSLDVLKTVHQRIDDMLRGSDEVVKTGEEFSILVSASLPEECEVVAERIRNAIESTEFTYEGKQIPVPISIYFAADNEEAAGRLRRA